MDVEMLIDKYQLNDSEAEVLRFMKKNRQSLKQSGFVMWLKHPMSLQQQSSIWPRKLAIPVIASWFLH